MKREIDASHRRALLVPFRLFLLGLALCWGAQAQARSCSDLYAGIKSASKYCGFFCEQEELRPLQVAYETHCMVHVIPAQLQISQPSPEAREAARLPSVLVSSQQLSQTVRATSAAQFELTAKRQTLAQAFLNYCKSAQSRIPYSEPRVGLTEDSVSPSESQVEFARWRLSTVFAGCTDAAYAIIEAPSLEQEARVWVKLLHLLDDEGDIRALAAAGQLSAPAIEVIDDGNFFKTDDWRMIRAFLVSALEKLPQ